jgi:hypothetical protein
MEAKDEASGSGVGKGEDVDALLGGLHLHEDEIDDFIWEEEAGESKIRAKWLAITRVHTAKLRFSQSALFADMRAAWNPVKEVVWWRVDDNLFTIHFN